METHLNDTYGAKYIARGQSASVSSPAEASYSFSVHCGDTTVSVDQGDCCFFLSDSGRSLELKRGVVNVSSKLFAVTIRGFAPNNQSHEILHETTLPYINGCSTRQIVPPPRPGDPTAQLLKMPAHTSEQHHHIHSTARVVYVLSGRGTSIVGMPNSKTETELHEGMTIILDPMCPHHFETADEPLVVLPIHIWSSVGPVEFSHPMYNGTHRIG